MTENPVKRENAARKTKSAVRGIASRDRAFAHGRAWAWGVAVSLIGILFCLYVAMLLHRQSEEAALHRFNYLIERFEKRLSDRFASFNLVVNMGMGMATLTDSISRRDWRRFVSGLNWREMSGGIGLNYVERVKRADLDRFLARAAMLNGEQLKIRHRATTHKNGRNIEPCGRHHHPRNDFAQFGIRTRPSKG